jgi:hypothetical protein
MAASMNFNKSKLHRLTKYLPDLIDQLPEEELKDAWHILQALIYDLYMLRAIQESKRTFSPGDTLTREDALQALNLL